MPEEWLIDGYNLYGLATAGQKSSAFSLEALLGLIADFSSSQKCFIRVVLDGVGNDKELEIYATKFCHVIYSQEVSADAYIERYLYKHRSHMTITVVTDDRAIADMARGGGARVWGAQAFFDLMKETKRENTDILFHGEVQSHAFNRPFEKKLNPDQYASGDTSRQQRGRKK